MELTFAHGTILQAIPRDFAGAYVIREATSHGCERDMDEQGLAENSVYHYCAIYLHNDGACRTIGRYVTLDRAKQAILQDNYDCTRAVDDPDDLLAD